MPSQRALIRYELLLYDISPQEAESTIMPLGLEKAGAMAFRKARILILCKTYPSPSARYAETSCVAGLEEGGTLIRLYPVPFRLITDAAKFKKWQWIEAKVDKTRKDHRPESHRIGVDTIICGDTINTRDGWRERRKWLDKIPVFTSFTELDQARADKNVTLGLLRPSRIIGLDITPCVPEWTDEEKKKLVQLQEQGNLFDQTDASSIAMLRKLPFDFHYRYACIGPDGGEVEQRHKLADWEVGALYWNVRRNHGDGWETPFRQKLEQNLPSQDLMFLMGTIHRFPEQWLITSLIYPPMPQPDASGQGSLF
jgi:hypothetical protein